MSNMKQTMQEAIRLMQTGDLHAATRAIQLGLRGAGDAERGYADSMPGGAGHGKRWMEGQFRVVPDASPFVRFPDAKEPPRHSPGHEPDQSFLDHRFSCDAGTLDYKLFIPANAAPGRLPLIVMLHGCMQTPDDFARGTRMNVLAQEHGYVVAYPAQSPRSNASKCWNWFRAGDQRRGSGEAALIAALTRSLVEEHGLDADRVYVAGLSAGGAMAAVLAATYPDVYAAIGVHSGLPFGVARDLPSALAAMRRGATTAGGAPRAGQIMVPAIVFHGDGDRTVDPCNGAAVVEQCIGTVAPGGDTGSFEPGVTVERGAVGNGHAYTRAIFTSVEGRLVAEHWIVHGAGHAWFGGDSHGSYTDPSGPDASGQMLRFFSLQMRRVIN
jgi:poly(hydroxyalkanoate) depolymerase family esterase